jgi:hypothetical protein
VPLWSILIEEAVVDDDDDDDEAENEDEVELKNCRCRMSISKEQVTRVRWLKGGSGMTEEMSRTAEESH